MFGQIIDIMQCGVGKKFAKMKNNIEFVNWFNLLERYAQYRYEFTGLPDTVNEKVLKQALIWFGSAAFFEKDDNLIALPAKGTELLNVYGEWLKAWTFGANGFNECIDLYISGQDESSFITKSINGGSGHKGKGVLIRENFKYYPFANYIYNYAWKLSDTSRTIDNERYFLKKPYLVTCKQEILPTVKKYFEKVDDNETYIVSTGIFDANDVNTLPTNLPTGALKDTEELLDWYLNQYLTLCGLNNNQDANKKERLIVDEVNANNESIDTNIQPMVAYINEQLEYVNKNFGVNIKCKPMKEEFEDEDIRGIDSGEDKSGSVSGDERSE